MPSTTSAQGWEHQVLAFARRLISNQKPTGEILLAACIFSNPLHVDGSVFGLLPKRREAEVDGVALVPGRGISASSIEAHSYTPCSVRRLDALDVFQAESAPGANVVVCFNAETTMLPAAKIALMYSTHFLTR